MLGHPSNNSFNRLTLNFYDKGIEKEFLEDYGDKSAKIVQVGLLLEFFDKRNPYDFEISNERIFAIGRKV